MSACIYSIRLVLLIFEFGIRNNPETFEILAECRVYGLLFFFPDHRTDHLRKTLAASLNHVYYILILISREFY